MKCPYCNCMDSKVIDSRPTENAAIRRRRECINCGKRFTTYEKIETLPVMVVKKDGRREIFDPEKIRRGLVKACQKRQVSIEKINELVDDIERQVYNSLEQEIDSQRLGEMVMDRLREVDEVAYVRFASVYRQFKDINTFMEELNKLLKES
ncbi:MAG: transcriptional regulator NrdR [Christensenellales bacterium]